MKAELFFRNGLLAAICFYCQKKGPYRSSTEADLANLNTAAGLSQTTITTHNHKANRFFYIPAYGSL